MSLTFNPFTGNLDYVGSGLIEPVPSIQFALNPPIVPLPPGKVAWNSDEETFDVGLNENVTLQLGQEIHYHVENASQVTIAQGTPVQYVTANGNSGKIRVEAWDGLGPSEEFLGIATSNIQAGESGYITHFGKVRGIQTNGANYGETWVTGDVVYAGISGGLTKTMPSAPNNKVFVAVITAAHASNGTMFVRPSYGSNLANDELVQLTNIGHGDTLVYDSGTARFENKNPLDNSILTSNNNIVLTSLSPTYQFINPTATIDVTLPTVTSYKAFVIKNTGTTGFGITVKTAGSVVIPPVIGNGYSMTVVWNGVNWEAL